MERKIQAEEKQVSDEYTVLRQDAKQTESPMKIWKPEMINQQNKLLFFFLVFGLSIFCLS